MQIRKISEQAGEPVATLEQLKMELHLQMVKAQYAAHLPHLPHLYWEGMKPEGSAVALANCIIAICAFCKLHNIDLEWAIKMSLDYRRSKQGE